MLQLNLRFRAAVRFHSQPLEVLANLANVSRQDLYDLVNEKRRPVENDPSVLPVAELLGFRPDDVFIEVDPEPGESDGHPRKI